jgi:hypothetical protein
MKTPLILSIEHRWSRMKSLTLACVSLGLALCASAHAQSYFDLHDFGGTVVNSSGHSGSDGFDCYSGVSFDSKGNAYGMTSQGGLYKYGLIWEITTTGAYLDLHDFGGTVTNTSGATVADGQFPWESITFDSEGNMYGTTNAGGVFGGGNVWEITTADKYVDLHDFGNDNDGSDPEGPVTVNSSGDLGGTAAYGGAHSFGMIWAIKSGEYYDLHDFGGTIMNAAGSVGQDGTTPMGQVTFDSDGNLYGTASEGGVNGLGAGMVWTISRSTGKYTDLHDFGGTITDTYGKQSTDGMQPQTGVTFDSAGNMYGTCYNGGPNGALDTQAGILWEITASGAYKDIHDFGGDYIFSNGVGGQDGTNPALGPIVIDDNDNLYGTAASGGYYQGGNLWRLSLTTSTYTDLHDFDGAVKTLSGTTTTDGRTPRFAEFDAYGNLYGTTFEGGAHSQGMIWDISSQSVISVKLSPTTVLGGNSSNATVTLSGKSPIGGTVVQISTGAGASAPTTVTVPAGQSIGSFTVTTVAVSADTPATITATLGSSSANATLMIDALLESVTVSGSSVIGGTSLTGTVTLSQKQSANTVITLGSSSSSAYFSGGGQAGAVTVPANSLSAQFTISTKGVSVATPVTITASIGPAMPFSPTANFTIQGLLSFTMSPTSVYGGAETTGTVTLTGPAPTSGAVVSFSSGNACVTVSPTVGIGGNTSFQVFGIQTSPVSQNTQVTVTATLAGISVPATLSVLPPALESITANSQEIVGGTSGTGTVTLTGVASSAGANVTLSSSNTSLLTVQSSVNIAGATYGTFTINTKAVKSLTDVTITAKLGSVTKTYLVIIVPPDLLSYTLTNAIVSSTVVEPVHGTVTLDGPAPAGGVTVTLKSSDTSLVTVPVSVSIAAGSTSATFTVKQKATHVTTTVTLTASEGGSSKTATLTISPERRFL